MGMNDWYTLVEYVVVALALIGNLLVAHKRRSGLWLWLVANCLACPVMLWAGLYAMAAQYGLFVLTTAYSIYRWGYAQRAR